MDELEKATAILAAALGVAPTEVADALKSDTAVDSYTTLFDDKFKEQRDQGNKTAIGKSRRDVERVFKAAGVEDASFDNLPAAIEALKGQAATGAAADLSPEQILKLKPVVDALNAERLKIDTAVEAARKEERQLLADKEQAFTKSQTDAKVRAEAEKLIDTLNPNFSKPTQRTKLIKEIVEMGGYQLDKDGKIQLVDEDGNLLDGKMGRPAQFDDRVREYTDEYYGLPVSTDKQSPGLTAADAASATASTQKFQGEKPKTAEDYAALMADDTISMEAKLEVKAWRAAEKPF